MIDLTQPIEVKGEGWPAVLVEKDVPGDKPYLVRWKSPTMGWSSAVYSHEALNKHFRNVPQKPRKAVVWIWWSCPGGARDRPVGIAYNIRDYAEDAAVAHGGHVQQVEVTEEWS